MLAEADGVVATEEAGELRREVRPFFGGEGPAVSA